jgi:YHS domain-containing protein
VTHRRTPFFALALVCVAPIAAQTVPTTQPIKAQPPPQVTTSAALPATQPAPILCPVTSRPIDRNIVTRFRRHWVYFATPEARDQFLKDPLEYAEGVQKQWEVDRPLRVQVTCPVTGEPPAPDIYTGEGLTAVFFADEAARRAYEADPARYVTRMATIHTYQTGCGACEMPIDPRVSRELKGRTIYFCCKGCAGEADKDPDGVFARADRQCRNNKLTHIHQLRAAGLLPPVDSAPPPDTPTTSKSVKNDR